LEPVLCLNEMAKIANRPANKEMLQLRLFSDTHLKKGKLTPWHKNHKGLANLVNVLHVCHIIRPLESFLGHQSSRHLENTCLGRGQCRCSSESL